MSGQVKIQSHKTKQKSNFCYQWEILNSLYQIVQLYHCTRELQVELPSSGGIQRANLLWFEFKLLNDFLSVLFLGWLWDKGNTKIVLICTQSHTKKIKNNPILKIQNESLGFLTTFQGQMAKHSLVHHLQAGEVFQKEDHTTDQRH